MKILFVSSECAPFAKVGGLGDVVGTLPKALLAQGHDVRVVLPRYGFLQQSMTRHEAPLGVPLGGQEAWCAVCESRLPGSEVPIYFLEHDVLFGGPRIYGPADGALHELARFGLLSRGALQLCRYLDFIPDVIHVHDWPTAPLPVMLNTVERGQDFDLCATVLTIHNMAYQPRFTREGLDLLEIGQGEFRPDGMEDHGLLNLFKGGIYHATMLTTVSPTYAKELRTPEGGAGLHGVLDFRGADLVGILNGIDEQAWDPRQDPFIEANFSPEDLLGKTACKLAIQKELGLEQRKDLPLIGVVTRLTEQKGVDIIMAALERILQMGAQVAILGSGDPSLEEFLAHRSRWGEGRFCAWIGFNEALAHRIEAGSDLFLMPSRFEPCGLNQMYSQRYGTVPVVRKTGGLADTVEPYDPHLGTGTGFLMNAPDPDELVEVVRQALQVYREQPARFLQLQQRGMNQRFGWSVAAKKYAEVYRWASERRRSKPKWGK